MGRNKSFILMRYLSKFLFVIPLSLTSCGYHTAGSSSHLPANLTSISVPIFQTQVENYHTEVDFTEAVIEELTSRTNYHVTPRNSTDRDRTDGKQMSGRSSGAAARLQGTILSEVYTPLTYNSQTGQSSSYLITITAKVVLTDHEGKVLYQNSNYIFRQQYQSTADLTSFIQEDSFAVHRLARDFAQALVSDLLDSF